MTSTGGLTLEYKPAGRNGTVQLSALFDGQIVHADKLDVGRATSRERFAKVLTSKCGGIDAGELDAELLRIANEVTAVVSEPVGYLPEVDVSRIVRPELFHAVGVSGIAVPTVTLVGGEPAGRWASYLAWADGRRERRELASSVELPDGSSLWLHPIPAAPAVTIRAGWTAQARQAWLDGESAPEPSAVFKALCEAFAYYLDFQHDTAAGSTATLALWVVLTYTYPAWSAVPYLNVGGPLSSGKSRVFELLTRFVFRPAPSANTTAPTLFRTLHESGGTLLLDEAERLRDTAPDAGELRSILLSGYKQGSPARRLEPTADGGFRATTFDVFGPKAIAGIATLPEALASRCIRLTMFRAAPDSPKPRRHIDADPGRWADLRNDLHALALEHGSTWLQLAHRNEVCPAMTGRDFELWQPLLALAAWFDEAGADGLLTLMQDHARQTIEAGREDAIADADETLLTLLADAVQGGQHVTCKGLLELAQQHDEATFGRSWSYKRVSNVLKRYGLSTRKSGSNRVVEASAGELARIQLAYGVDLGMLPFSSSLSSQSSHDPA